MIIYFQKNPNIIESVISQVYCNVEINSIKNYNGIFYHKNCKMANVIPGKYLKNIFSLECHENEMYFYYATTDVWNIKYLQKIIYQMREEGTLHNHTIVYGIYGQNIPFEIFGQFNFNGDQPKINKWFSYRINFDKKQIQKRERARWIHIFEPNDYIMMTKYGLLHVNPPSEIDMMMSFLMYHTEKVSMKFFINRFFGMKNNPCINFLTKLKKLNTVHPNNEYKNIFHLVQTHENAYFNRFMTHFQAEIVQLINSTDTEWKQSQNFGKNLKKDFAYEITNLYHRLLLFPHEKEMLYQRYPHHPYIELLQMIFKTGCYHYESVYRFLEHSKTRKFQLLLINAIGRRSKIFDFYYNLYLNSNRTKIHLVYPDTFNYFPFRIFSPYLFLMEHIIN